MGTVGGTGWVIALLGLLKTGNVMAMGGSIAVCGLLGAGIGFGAGMARSGEHATGVNAWTWGGLGLMGGAFVGLALPTLV